MTIYSIFTSFTWTHPLTIPLTHPLTHPYTHPYTHPKVRTVPTNHKSSNRTELSRLDQVLLKFLVISHDLTHKPTHLPTLPSNHTPTHGWESLHKFKIFKQNQKISICSSSYSIFTDSGGAPPWGHMGGWVGVGLGGGNPHACTCTCMDACTHMHMCMHPCINMINMAASLVVAICNFLTCLF